MATALVPISSAVASAVARSAARYCIPAIGLDVASYWRSTSRATVA